MSLLEQFKSAVDMMHHQTPLAQSSMAAPASYTVPAPPPVPYSTYVPPSAPPPPPPTTLPLPFNSTAASSKPSFLSKYGVYLIAAFIVVVGGTAIFVFLSAQKKKKHGGDKKKGKKSRKGSEDDEDDDLVPHVPGRIPTATPLPYPPNQQPRMPPPVATSIPVSGNDARYTDTTTLRGAPLPPNTRGADMMQPGAGPHAQSMMYPGQQPSAPQQQGPPGLMPLPPPTMTATGLPLQPQVPPQGVPNQPLGGGGGGGDPNFTRL